jgi:hypothetical protein
VSRRAALTTLAGVGVAGLMLALLEPARRLLSDPRPDLPDWTATLPKGGDAYAAALARPELLATLPCFCGCASFEQAHGDLRDCFFQASGELEPHAAFCETCQDEALDAAGWARQGASQAEIHDRIVAAYADRDSASGGSGCGGPGTMPGAACAP